MHRPAGRLLALLLLGLVLLPAAASAQLRPPLVGIADQKVQMFTDPLFAELGVGTARVVVPWDAMDGGFQHDELVAWLTAARADHVTPLVTFGPSRRPGRQKVAPTPAAFQRQFRRFRLNFPWVTEFSTWNEANHCSYATCQKPQLAARYFDALVRACPSCTILGADLLDTPNMVSWLKRFEKAAVHRPKVWALHNYVDTNRFTTTGTRAMLRATKAQIWLTETGGIVARKTKSKIPLQEGVAHAAAATRWLFDKLLPLSPRIRRVYLYHWNPSQTAGAGWDSALLDPHGRARAAYRVVQARIRSGAVDVGSR